MGDSSLGRLIGVLTSPSQAFAALREKPTWALALIVLLILGGGVSQYAQSKVDAGEMVRSFMEGGGRDFTEEQIEEAIARQEGQNPAVTAVTSLAFMAAIAALGALFFWIGTKVFGGDPSFGQSMSVFTHAMLPWWGIKSLLSIPALASRSRITFEDATSGGILPSNLGFLMPADASMVMKGVAASVDLFSLWSLFLMIVGYSIVARVSRVSTTILAVILWVLVTGVTLIPALLVS